LQAVSLDKKFLSLVLRFSERQITDFEFEKNVIRVYTFVPQQAGPIWNTS